MSQYLRFNGGNSIASDEGVYPQLRELTAWFDTQFGDGQSIAAQDACPERHYLRQEPTGEGVDSKLEVYIHGGGECRFGGHDHDLVVSASRQEGSRSSGRTERLSYRLVRNLGLAGMPVGTLGLQVNYAQETGQGDVLRGRRREERTESWEAAPRTDDELAGMLRDFRMVAVHELGLIALYRQLFVPFD